MIDAYPVVELFKSVQGEGSLVGTVALFIRLAGCNRVCSWCDTDHTKQADVQLDTLLDVVKNANVPLVVITGGEPMLHDLRPLCDGLSWLEKQVQIETNGDFIIDPAELGFPRITVSPKTPDFKQRSGMDLKLVFTGQTDLTEYSEDTDFENYFLQPCWDVKKDRLDKVQMISIWDLLFKFPDWRLSLQTHKFLGVK